MFTFVLRFWRETSGEDVRWRGRIEHVRSEKQADFLDINGLVSFLNCYGIDAKPRLTNSDINEDRTEDI